MQAFEAALSNMLSRLESRRHDKASIDELVADALASPSLQHHSSSENWKPHWEYVLRDAIFNLAAIEGSALQDAASTYYRDLDTLLDVALTFTEHDACEQTFPFNILYDLLETQTIASCSHVFSWIEARAGRLTEGMVPQKGKALILLRTLNDLLRRLSKMGGTTLFCGRILTFLSQVFPLGERSGVNLRGEYGPVWDGPGGESVEKGKEDKDAEMKVDSKEKETADAMQVDEQKAEEGKSHTPDESKPSRKDQFYQVFWALQLPFSKPTVFADQMTFVAFKESVSKILPVIKEATAKERALMGSKANNGGSTSLKRKRDVEINFEPQGQEYFFAKYLTSPDLLDLEIADTHFRRQFLFQLLILLNHLLTFTKDSKAKWLTPRNRSLQIDFTLEPEDTQWVQEIIQKTSEELRQTTPSGRAFAETVHVILEREKNWVRWKNELCAPFDKVPWAREIEDDEGGKRRVGLEEATREVRRKLRQEPEPWPLALGSESLTEIWQMGFRDLHDLQHPFQPGDLQDFVKKIKQEDARIEMRKKQLRQQAERIAQARARQAAAAAAASAAPSPAPAPPAAPAEGAVAAKSVSTTPAPTATPPLHPSLPAKPGTTRPAQPPAQPAEAPAIVAPTPTAAVAPTPAPVPAPAPTPTPAPPPVVVEPVLPPDDQINKYEDNKQRWSWLALRTTRDQYLQHLSKIGNGDILQLAQEIENEERLEKEKAAKEAAAAKEEGAAGSQPPVALNGASEGDGVLAVTPGPEPEHDPEPAGIAGEGAAAAATAEDVKMET